jgi:hypothetical protein
LHDISPFLAVGTVVPLLEEDQRGGMAEKQEMERE